MRTLKNNIDFLLKIVYTVNTTQLTVFTSLKNEVIVP